MLVCVIIVLMGYICMRMVCACLVIFQVVRCVLVMDRFVRSVGRVCTLLANSARLVLKIVSSVRLKVVPNALMGSILKGLHVSLVQSSAYNVRLTTIVRNVGLGIQNGRENVCNV